MTGLPTVSVIVPHYEDLASLDKCLAALGQQTYPADRVEIVVSDNMSASGEEAVRGVIGGRASLVLATERGAGPARNAGVAASAKEVLAFTDADCLPEPGWIEAGIRALEQHDFVGGRVVVLVEDEDRMTPAEAFEREFAFENDLYVEKKGFSVTANLFCRRSVFDRVGGFRNGLSEDYDWCQRATQAGFRIGYAPDAVVGHPARKDWPAIVKKWRRLNAETFTLFSERRFGRVKWLVRTWALPLSAVAHTPRVLTSRRIPKASQRLSALSMLYRLRLWRFFHSHAVIAARKQD